MNIYSRKRLKVTSRHSSPFSPWENRREHVQEALVKETGWNDGVAGPKQRRVLSVGRDVCYTTVSHTQLYQRGSIYSQKKGLQRERKIGFLRPEKKYAMLSIDRFISS